MKHLLPGATIGILGGGQLARMLALEARRMGYRTIVLDPDARCAAAPAADVHIQALLDDPEAHGTIARLSDVVTLDTEHVPAAALEHLERLVPLYPGSHVLRVIQDRLVQRQVLSEHGFPQVRHAAVEDEASLREGLILVGTDGVLKTRRHGYDGRGQIRVRSEAELWDAFHALGAPAVLEAFVPFVAEISVVVARGRSGDVESFPVADNVHERHVLAYTVVPSRQPAELQRRAIALAEDVAAALDVVGLCAVELFVTREGGLLVNEVAPRSHNSGHYTWGAADVSQFEQQLRAVCGLPLAQPTLLSPALMVNLLGDLWANGEPRWDRAFAIPRLRLHLYGKTPSPGRKMGHLLWLGDAHPDHMAHELRRILTVPDGRASGAFVEPRTLEPSMNRKASP